MSAQRSATFALSDIRSAAEDFVDVVAEFSDPMWDEDDKVEMSERLVERALRALWDSEAEL